jgi:uncharacterized membrane protein
MNQRLIPQRLTARSFAVLLLYAAAFACAYTLAFCLADNFTLDKQMQILFWLSLVPVLTEWLRDEYQEPLPAAAYGLVLLAAGFAYSLLVHALIRANGKDSAVARAIGSDVKGNISLVIYAAAVPLAFVSPWISYALYVAVALLWFVPDRRFVR